MTDGNIDDGGPVHPCNIPTGERKPIDMRLETTREVFKHHYGLSLRDHFAAMAMQSVCDTYQRGELVGHESSRKTIAETSYAIADAMLEARKR